jgi:hypothetical protein
VGAKLLQTCRGFFRCQTVRHSLLVFSPFTHAPSMHSAVQTHWKEYAHSGRLKPVSRWKDRRSAKTLPFFESLLIVNSRVLTVCPFEPPDQLSRLMFFKRLTFGAVNAGSIAAKGGSYGTHKMESTIR